MTTQTTRDAANAPRLRQGDDGGHYESYFQRANHGTRPLAFWIRYTLLVPRGRPDQGVCELWAIYFDGERGRIAAVKERRPLADCELSARPLSVRIGAARLGEGALSGAAASAAHRIAWELDYTSPQPPLMLLPERLYRGGFPKAKSLVGSPHACYRGALEVDGERVEVDGWIGSQNHNWGQRHTDRYAWGQVAGFDGASDAFLECASAKLRLGPLWTPWITPVVCRLDGREYRCNALATALRARAELRGLEWRFETAGPGVRLTGRIGAPRSAFVGLGYDDPGGRKKICLNTKLARCELTVELAGAPARTLTTQTRAAFELLSDDDTYGVPVVL